MSKPCPAEDAATVVVFQGGDLISPSSLQGGGQAEHDPGEQRRKEAIGQHATIEGEVQVSNEETVWKFLPKSEWAAGDYEIRVDNRLEDLCGNSISKPFDVDVLENKPSGSDGVTVLEFQVR